jgi:hypothetical protein
MEIDGSSSHLASDEITTRGYRTLHLQSVNYHDRQACGYKRSGILPKIVGMVGNGVVLVETL